MIGAIKLVAKFLDGRSIELDGIDPSETVGDLKERIRMHTLHAMYAVDRTVVLFSGKLYKNSRTLSECGIGDGAVLHVLLNLGGPDNNLLQKNAI